MSKNLTTLELRSLADPFNLTDGHAFRHWTPAEAAVVDGATHLLKTSSRRHQADIERAYVHDFLRLARQTGDDGDGYLMCFTASMALEVVANHLRLNRLSVALIEPCFDNLADIFLRHGVPKRPVVDPLLEAPGDVFERALLAADTDAICLVTPNNPTGTTLGEANLRRLLDFCKERGKLLILDNCFRAYLPRRLVHDQYRLVLEAGVDAVLIEDTGKTWPTSELKAPFFAVTRGGGLFDRLYEIYTDFLLHVSPVAVRLAHEFIKLSLRDELRSVHDVIRVNRDALDESIAGTFLTPCERPFASVAWLRIDHPMSAAELKGLLEERGVFVLPGNQFFWHDRSRGDRFIRVALNRDADVFRDAAAVLGDVCRRVGGPVRV